MVDDWVRSGYKVTNYSGDPDKIITVIDEILRAAY